MSYLRYYLCLFVDSGVQHILRCVFLRLVYPLVPFSLDCHLQSQSGFVLKWWPCRSTRASRDRPFNLQGEGVMVFCFVQNFFFGQHELEYLFFLSRKVLIFFPEFNIRLYNKNSGSDFVFLHQNQNIFFSNFGNQNIFLEKKHTPPHPLSS